MEQRYWSSVLNNRIGRRRAIVATGASALGAAFLAACGGSDSGGSGGGSKESSGVVTKPVDTSKAAKKGGVLKDRNFGDPPSLDVIQATVSWNPFGFGVYSSLVQPAPGYLKPAGEELLPDIAESWETSPDGMTLTLKIRQNVKWHNKAPVNGRAMTIDDVVASWERMAAKGSARSGIVNKVSPAAPILSFTATDARTIQVKLKEPLVYALALLGGTTNGGLVIVPKETDSTFDPKQDMIGTGPYSLAKYTQRVGFTFKRNDEYWDKEWAYIDDIEMPIVTEYAQALAQLKAGNIYRFTGTTSSDIKSEDVLPLKRDEPRMNVYLGDLASAGVVGAILAFGWLPIDGKPSPLLDERVRQAMSMAIDRDTYLDTFHNVKNLAKEGIQIENRWDSHLISTQEGWWLDPQGKDFGPNAKYFKFDLAEAKKLLAAAGYPSGFEAPSNYVTSPELGAHPKSAEVEDGFLSDLGIKVKTNPINYTREYQPNYRDGRGQFMGWGYVAAVGSHGGSAIGRLATEFWSDGGNAFKGFSTTGQNDQKGDPTLDAMFLKGRVEADDNKRKAIVNDIQRYLGKAMYAIPQPGRAASLTAAWPALANWRVWQTDRPMHKLWIDTTKAPFKSS
jgi:peptide/nickel transport system substrate-binding protein